jgi:Ribonuclease G/E
MSDKKPYQKPYRKPVKQAPVLTVEERAAVLEAVKKRQADEKAERERVELYGKSLPKLSHRQLAKELKKAVKREYQGKPPQPQAGLNIALASILSLVLENTNTPENPFGKLHSYPR